MYDSIIWFAMAIMAPISYMRGYSTLPLLIVASNSLLYLNTKYIDAPLYYDLEGVRHTVTVLLVIFLWTREKHHDLYGLYCILYIMLAAQFTMGYFHLIPDIEMNMWALMLDTLELVIFMYGTSIKNNNNSAPIREY